MMEEIVDRSTELGVESIVMGMPHRGMIDRPLSVFQKKIISDRVGKKLGLLHYL